MESRYSKRLFIFEMANNHVGSLSHGLRILQEIHQASLPFQSQFRLAVKLQCRPLDTFIHPAWREKSDVKYIKRFRETRLNEVEFQALKAAIDDLGFLAICTPFDEKSVMLIERHEFDVIKIGSCSLTDWPLLERVVGTEKPVIASVATVAST